jgi:hypothetical protein
MPSIVDKLLALSGVISKGRAPEKGQTALTGTVPYNGIFRSAGGDSAKLIISSKSPYLPVSISFSDPVDGTDTLTFSKWGEHVPLVAPSSPLTLPGGATFAASSDVGGSPSALESPATQAQPAGRWAPTGQPY